MVMLLALGAMSLTWSCVVGALVLGQKLLPPWAIVDAAVALAILTLGIVVTFAPSSLHGLA
jgi:hypothetical protein